MRFVTALLFSAVSATAVADPNVNIAGEYSFVGYECASGVPIVDILKTELMTATINGDISISESTMSAKMVLNYKFNEKFTEFSLGMLREELSKAKNLPDTDPKKASTIAEIEDQIAQTENQGNGVTCNMNAEFSYSVAGDLLSSKTTQSTATCEGMALDDLDSVDVQKIVVEGDLLKLVNTDSGKNKDRETCPTEGDHTVIVYKKK